MECHQSKSVFLAGCGGTGQLQRMPAKVSGVDRGWSAGECQGGTCNKQSISTDSHKDLFMLAGGGDEKWCLPTLLFLEKFPKDSDPAAHVLR